MDDDNQWITLKEKFVSVLEPVIASGDENNIAILLSSLSNIYRPAGGFTVPLNLGSSEELKAAEFTCWLISQLLSINSTINIHNAVTGLLTNIFHLIGIKNPKIFPHILKEFLEIGKYASNILFGEEEKTHPCFLAFLNGLALTESSLKPKQLHLKNDESLDRLLSKIIEVIGNISGDIILIGTNYVDEAWLLIGKALEAGDLALKILSLKIVGLMLVSCRLPEFIERQDYILQLIGSCITGILSDNLKEPKVNMNESASLQANLCFAVSKLYQQISGIHPCLALDVLESIGQFLNYSMGFDCISGNLLKELLLFANKLLELYPDKMQSNIVRGGLEKAMSQNLCSKEVIEVCLKKFIVKELEDIYPKSGLKKRTFYESEVESTIIQASSVSRWWSKVESEMQALLETLVGEIEYSEFIQTVDTFIQFIELASDIVALLPLHNLVTLVFIQDKVLCTLTEIIFATLSQMSSLPKVLKTMSLLHHIVFINNVSRAFNVENVSSCDMHHLWVALASLPWLANEVKWMDLKTENLKLVASIASKATWSNDYSLKVVCLPILALTLRNIAPQWRCHIVRSILLEGNALVLNCIAEWLPMILHHLPNSSSQSILGEALGKLFTSQDSCTLKRLSSTLDVLFCSILNTTIMKPREGNSCGANSLTCNRCHNSGPEINRPAQFVDITLVQRFLILAKSSDNEIVLNFINSLPAIVEHCNVSPNLFNQILEILCNEDEIVVEKFCKKIHIFLEATRNEEKNQSDFRNGKLELHLFSFLENIILSGGVGLSNKKLFFNQLIAVLKVFECLAEKRLLPLTSSTLFLLMRCLVSSEQEISARAHLFVSEWASHLSMTPKEMYGKNNARASQILSEFLREGEVALILNHFSEVFCWGFDGKRNVNSCQAFANRQLPYLLPPLVVRACRDNKPVLLQELATCVGIRLREMIIDHFQYVLSYIVFNCSPNEKDDILQFISTTTDLEIQGIRKCTVQNQVNELIMGLHDHRDVVMKEFIALQTIENEKENNPNLARNVGQFLAPRLLGILGFLDGKLVSASTGYREKLTALLSLSDLLLLMGKEHVSPVARKVLASLKTALKIKSSEFMQVTCQAWTSYLRSLDEATLVGIIEEVIIIIKPLIREKPQDMSSILHEIIIETVALKPLLKDLPLLPLHPVFADINTTIKEAQNSSTIDSPDGLGEVLKFIHKGLTHDSIDVKQHYLNRLKNILTNQQKNIHRLILDSDKVHDVISKVYYALLELCREGEHLHILVAECFGLFGAIDSARLVDANDKEKASIVYLNIEAEDFVHDLIMGMSRIVLSATDTQTQTCALYALQEILRLYKIGASTRNDRTLGSAVYASLPSNVQGILIPLHSSKYTISSSGNKPSTSSMPCPVFGSKQYQTFNQWLTNWVCSLNDLLIGERPKQVFSSCKPVMRRDTQTAMELLSPLLVCVLSESYENHAPVLAEILVVISNDCISRSQSAELEHSLNSSNNNFAKTLKDLRHRAVQTIFSCLDYVNRWAIAEKRRQVTPKNRIKQIVSIELQRVLEFLDKVPINIIAECSFKFQAYSRSLRNLEIHIKESPDQLKNNLRFMQSIYVALDEPDGVAGVAAIRQDEPTLHEQIIEHEATGSLHDALACYERLCTGEGSENLYKGMLKCYLSLDQPQSVLNITQGLMFRQPHLTSKLNEFRVEAAWRLGQWDQLKEFLEIENPPSWGVGVGKVLLAAKDRNVQAYAAALKDLRIQQITPLSVASMELGAFQRASPCILRLQILNELEEMLIGLLKIQLVDPHKSNEFSEDGNESRNHYLTLEELNKRWDQRLSLVQTSHRCLEPLLNFRRILLQIGCDWSSGTDGGLSQTLSVQLERTWLHSAKIARKSGLLQHGEWSFFGAGYGRDVFMEKAKWYWMKGEQHQAVSTLKRGIDKFFPNIEKIKENANELESKKVASQAKLLLARYSEESSIIDVHTVKKFYRESCDINKQWEDSHFHLGLYYDRLLSTLDVKEKPSDWLLHIIQSFGKSLSYGCKHLYQSMPRLLSIWLDFGAKVAQMDSKKNEEEKKLKEMNTYLEVILERLPYYMFLIALPQLISRICHSREDVFQVLKLILSKMLCQYPQQAMWHMVQVSKSSYEMRRTRCLQVFDHAKRSNPQLAKFTADATKLADLFIELSNKHVDKGVVNVNINNIVRALPKFLSDSRFSNIILPLHNQITVTLPSNYDTDKLQDLLAHKPFPSHEIHLRGIEENIEVMQSLIQPKKITLRGSDGLRYSMMCKPKDDMRKDCRLMEFNSFLNRLLTRDPDSRRRNLKIRTYIVVPLNEECGLIEWVPNLCGLRHVIFKLYREANKYTSGSELKKYMCKTNDTLQHKRNIFCNHLLPRHPPILNNWFLETFFDPQTWLRARMSYCRTTAVMSMVGYILGLGDRHGENILFDSSSGDIVHVDFNCLFNKGETFDYPERVPFRLTHNMVDAMGPTGYEGVFRKASEVTMRVMRNEREELMSVLKPFIHDPLVEWGKADKSHQKIRSDSSSKTGGEIYNLKAQMHVQHIEERLNGQINTKGRGVHLPLSVEGQVNVLIEEATSIDNLCQMYIGWAPFM